MTNCFHVNKKKPKLVAKGKFEQSLYHTSHISNEFIAPLASWLNHFYMVPTDQEVTKTTSKQDGEEAPC